jgi:hypothetical protein
MLKRYHIGLISRSPLFDSGSRNKVDRFLSIKNVNNAIFNPRSKKRSFTKKFSTYISGDAFVKALGVNMELSKIQVPKPFRKPKGLDDLIM